MTTPRKTAPAKKTAAKKTAAAKSPAARKTTARKTPARKTTTAPRKTSPRRKAPVHVSETVAEVADALAKPAASPVEPDPSWGPVQRATRYDLGAWGVGDSALSQAAYQLAREIDSFDSAAAMIGAARELRHMVRAAKADKRTRPVPGEPPTGADGEPVEESELDKLRRKRKGQAG